MYGRSAMTGLYLLADPDVQAVYISTPHPQHAEWCVKAARAKKLVAAKHETRLNELLGPANRAALLGMLETIAREF